MATLEQNGEGKENFQFSKTKQLNQVNDDGVKPGSYEEVQRRLKDALEKNVQWQAYNVERENYVTRLLLQFNQLSADLSETKMKLDQVTRDPLQLQTEQRRHFDDLLVTARQQISKKDAEIIRSKDEISCLKKSYTREIDEYAQMIEHWRSKCNKHKLAEAKHQQKKRNADDKDVLSMKDLHTQMKLYFDDLREENDEHRNLESENTILVDKVAKLERKLENAKKINKKQQQMIAERKLDNDDVTGADDRRVTSSRDEKPPLPKEGGHKHKKHHQKKDEEQKIEVKFQNFTDPPTTKQRSGGRLSYQQEVNTEDGHLKPPRSARRHQSYEPSLSSSLSMLVCPGCDAEYPYSDHQLLIAHIDVCVK